VSVQLSEGAGPTHGYGACCGRPCHPDDSSLGTTTPTLHLAKSAEEILDRLAGYCRESGGGTMRTRALFAALTVTLALATASPAVAGQEQATRIVWTQVLDDEFTTARIVSARPDGSGLRALTHPTAGEFDLSVTARRKEPSRTSPPSRRPVAPSPTAPARSAT
jgi:hypothetical protein